MISASPNKLARVSRMDWDEIRTRLAQELQKRQDLLRHRLGLRPEPTRLRMSSSEGKFFFAKGEAATRALLLRQHLPGEAAGIVQDAEQICEHRFDLLGYENLNFGAGREIDWHLDPVHGKRAPLDPWFHIPFLKFAVAGDHKVTWELNRHQHMVTLAKAWLLTGDQKYVREIISQWHSWAQANPYPLGINWASTLEVAFRSLSWIWVDHLLSDATGYAEFRAELLPALAFHGRYIERYLSTYFSPNTHLLGEVVAMFFVGTLYPQMPHARSWKENGWQIVLREAGRQVRPDGVYFEQALYYHVYALDLFLHARALAAANSMQIPANYDGILRTMLRVIQALAQAGPAEGFGDDDGGRLFNPRRNQTEHMTDPLALGAVTYDCDDTGAACLTEESIWLFGESAVAKLGGTEGRRSTSSTTSAEFPDGGLYVLADREPFMQVAVVDAGPQGAGRCGHGHADALSLRLTMNGSRWLVDSGSGVYISSDPADRNAFRGTEAHNTIRVDGVDQAIPGEPFAWTGIPTTRAESWVAGRTFTYFSGSHDGYARLPDPVTHRRHVFNVKGCANAAGRAEGIWLVRDELVGNAVHNLELDWHFASDLVVSEAGENELVVSKPEARAEHQPEAQAETRQLMFRLIWPEETIWKARIGRGLLSPAYGRYESASLVRLEGTVKLPGEIATGFLAGASRTDGSRMVSIDHGAVQVYELHVGEESHDFYFGRDNQPWSFGPWSSDAELLYCRMVNETIGQLIVIGGSSAEWQGRALFQGLAACEYFEWRRRDGTMHAKPATFSTTSYVDELTARSASSSTSSSNTTNATASFAEKH